MFNFLGAIGGMLPGYVEGREKAIQSNWNDLNQYNQVQEGQLRNLWSEATFNPKLQMQYDAAEQSDFLTRQAARTNALGEIMFPGQSQAARVQGAFMPQMAYYDSLTKLLYGLMGLGGFGGFGGFGGMQGTGAPRQTAALKPLPGVDATNTATPSSLGVA